jgi:drug/metabolite transporter (DMT)-like permease
MKMVIKELRMDERQGEELTRRIPPVLGLVIGVLAVSTASTFIRLAQTSIPSLAVAAWRLTIASLLLAPLAVTRCRAEWRALSRRQWRWAIASGVILAIHFYSWITSLAMTSVAASVVLVTTAPLFVGVISHFVLDERLTLPMIFGLAVALVGSIIIGVGDLSGGGHQLAGDGLALIGAVAAALYMLIGRSLRARLSLLGYIFPVYGTAALTLMALALLSGAPLTGYPSRMWLWLALMALIPQIVGHSSLNWALGHLPATYVSLSVLLEPVGSTLLAWLILTEPPTWAAVIGGALILAGVVIATLRKRPAKSKSPISR